MTSKFTTPSGMVVDTFDANNIYFTTRGHARLHLEKEGNAYRISTKYHWYVSKQDIDEFMEALALVKEAMK